MSGATVKRFRIGIGIGFAMLLAMPLPVAAVGADTTAAFAPADAAGAAATSSYIVTFKPGADARQTAPVMAKAVGGKAGLVFRHALHGFVFQGSARALAALRKNANVRSIVPNGKITALADTITTGVSRIRANHPTDPSAYGSGFTGKGVRVAILDTGVDLTHPDLVPNLDIGLGRNCITTGPPQDGHGHGTHVAGIVAAAANGIGVVGVAPEARIVPIKVLDDTGQGEWSNLICAVDYLTGLMTDGDPTNDVRVANMSLGDVGTIGTCTDGGIREAICHSVAAGVVYVAAAGNSTVDVSTFIPAAFPEVIAVSALTDLDGEPGGLGGCWLFFFYCDDTLAEFSNYGAGIAVTAPGTQILSDWTGGGYATEMGTSMASPHVAGVAALILAANPALSPAEVEDLLKTSGECPNGALADADGSGNCIGKGQWGNDPDGIAEPLVNAFHAVDGVNGDRRPVIHITAPTDGATVSGPVAVTATATDDIGVAKVQFFVNGSLAATDANGADGWSMTWDASAVAGGRYTIKATATDTIGQTSFTSVSVQTGTNLQGTWLGNYGQDGYILGNWTGTADLASLPTGVTYTVEQAARYTWASPSTDLRALQSPTGTERRAQTWYDANEVRIRLNFTNAYSGTLHVYALDWDAYGPRGEDVSVNDGSGLRTGHLAANSFVNGAWIHFPLTIGAGGSIVVTADRTAGGNAVLSGLFLGGTNGPPPPPTAPGAPTGLSATPGNAQVVLAWTAPASDGGSAITGYTATASPGGATCATATLTCTIAGLTNGTPYSFTVKAANIVGPGPASAPASATPVAPTPPPPTAPGAPTGLSATPGNAQVVLAWTAPASDGGSAITGYRIYRGTSSGGETLLANVGVVTTYTATSLTNGTIYFFQVSAVNTIGESGRSAEASAKPATVPTAPRNVTATANATRGVNLTWTAPSSTGGSAITGYRIYRSTSTGTETFLIAVGNVTSYIDKANTAGVRYFYKISAVNAVGEGPRSAETNARAK